DGKAPSRVNPHRLELSNRQPVTLWNPSTYGLHAPEEHKQKNNRHHRRQNISQRQSYKGIDSHRKQQDDHPPRHRFPEELKGKGRGNDQNREIVRVKMRRDENAREKIADPLQDIVLWIRTDLSV